MVQREVMHDEMTRCNFYLFKSRANFTGFSQIKAQHLGLLSAYSKHYFAGKQIDSKELDVAHTF